MRPVSLALDQLQPEEKAFMGILLPTLAMAIKKLRDVLANNEVAVCVPLDGRSEIVACWHVTQILQRERA